MRDEIDVRNVRRIECRDDRWLARRRDRSRRQSLVLVGVVRRIDLEMLVEHARHVVAECVLHRGVGLQLHAGLQAIEVHRGNHGSLFWKPRFLLDDGRECHDVVAAHRVRLQRRIPRRLPDLLKAADHQLDCAARRGAVGKDVGVGKEIALQRRRRNVERMQERGIAHGGLHGIHWRVQHARELRHDLLERPAFRDRDALLDALATLQDVEHLAPRKVGHQDVRARLDRAAAAPEHRIDAKRSRVANDMHARERLRRDPQVRSPRNDDAHVLFVGTAARRKREDGGHGDQRGTDAATKLAHRYRGLSWDPQWAAPACAAPAAAARWRRVRPRPPCDRAYCRPCRARRAAPPRW